MRKITYNLECDTRLINYTKHLTVLTHTHIHACIQLKTCTEWSLVKWLESQSHSGINYHMCLSNQVQLKERRQQTWECKFPEAEPEISVTFSTRNTHEHRHRADNDLSVTISGLCHSQSLKSTGCTQNSKLTHSSYYFCSIQCVFLKYACIQYLYMWIFRIIYYMCVNIQVLQQSIYFYSASYNTLSKQIRINKQENYYISNAKFFNFKTISASKQL